MPTFPSVRVYNSKEVFFLFFFFLFFVIERTCLSVPEAISLTTEVGVVPTTPPVPLILPIYLASLLLALQQSLSAHAVSVARYLGTNIFTDKLLASFAIKLEPARASSSELLKIHHETGPPLSRDEPIRAIWGVVGN